MCLIIHKPAGLPVPTELLRAALALNRDGWGAMGFAPDGRPLLERRLSADAGELIDWERRHRAAEYALHLRRRTRGDASLDNVHPLRIVSGLYLMHNGTLPLQPRHPGQSDSAHLAGEILRPLALRYPRLLADSAFRQLLELSLKPENKIALLSQRDASILILNRRYGAELDGLWLSSTRWIDRRRFPLVHAPQPQEREYRAPALRFAS